MSVNQIQFEHKFKQYLDRNRYSRAQLSRELGYHPSTVHKWIKGINKVPIDALLKICLKLNLNDNEKSEFFNLAGHSISLISEVRVNEQETKQNPNFSRWSGKVDINLKGLQIIVGYDLWFCNEATGEWRIWHLDSNANLATPTNHKVTTGSSTLNLFAPAISPSNNKIVFSAGLEVYQGVFERNLYMASLDGTEIIQLTDDSFDNYNAAWSPAGDQVAFSKGSFGKPGLDDVPYGLWLFDLETGQMTQLTDLGDYDPAWSPKGQYIACQSKSESWNITILDLQSHNGLVNGCDTWTASILGSNASGASWKNDHQIVFSSNFEGTWQLYQLPVVENRTFTNPIRLTNNGWDNLYPKVFDDRLLIWQAYQHELSGEEGGGTSKLAVIYVMDLVTHQQAPLITGIGNARNGFLQKIK